MLFQIFQSVAVSPERTRGEQSIVRRLDHAGSRRCERGNRNKSRLRLHIVAAKQIQTVELVARHQPLNLIEKRERIKGAQLWFQAIGRKPDSVPIRLARLRSSRLPKIGSHSARAERNQCS